jgi:uncharacterized protein YndB with AHSA1/START domain
MGSDAAKTRTIVSEIEIDATIEAVWKALTDAEELTRWLASEARVTPGVGGSMWLSWGEGQSGESRIETWEPGRRLIIRNLPWDSAGDCGGQYDEKAATETPMIQEFILESRGGKTVLRLVDSGIPDSPEWEGMYDGKTRGWLMFFQALRHYLVKHPGKTRNIIVEMRPVQGSLTDAWEKFTGPQGLAASGSFAGTSEGSRYSVTASTGDHFEGEVLINMPPKTLSITIENMDDALLSGTFEDMGGTTFLYFTLATFGTAPGNASELSERWTGLLQRLFPTAETQDMRATS